MARIAILVAAVLLPASLAPAHEEIFQTTTEYGVTVTTTDLVDAIQETQDFWYPVRAYIASDKFAAADPATRKQAAEFIRKVNNRLADQLFSQDESKAIDLIGYLSTRLRLFATYRELRTIVGDDPLTMSVKEHWENELRAAHAHDGERRVEALALARAHVQYRVDDVTVDCDARNRCLALFDRAAQLWSRSHDSQAGKIMLEYEREVNGCDPQLAELIRDIVCAADWAQVVKTEQRVLKRADFERAWVDWRAYRGSRVAASPAGDSATR